MNSMNQLSSIHSIRSKQSKAIKSPRQGVAGDDFDGGGDHMGGAQEGISQPIDLDKTSKPKMSECNLAEGVEGLEGQLTNEKLLELEAIFEEADEDDGGGLDHIQFRQAMRQAINHALTDHDLDIMFMKVDTNCDGTVDWDEYLSYMLLEYREKDQMLFLNKDKPFPNRLRLVPHVNKYQRHHDCIVTVTHMPNLVKDSTTLYKEMEDRQGRYITITKEGVLNFWSMEFHHSRRFELETTRNNTWVTGMVVLPNANMCAVATTGADITFYDFAAGGFKKILQVHDLEICATCMDYWYDQNAIHHAYLMWGDARGNIVVLEFSECVDMCVLQTEIRRARRVRVPLCDLAKGTTCGVKVHKLNGIHADFVHDVKYCPSLNAFLSCSRDQETALFMGDIELRRKAYFRVRKGVFTFDYSKSNNIIVTGGKDALVRVWNPYMPLKPVMLLHGHKSAVVSVQVNERLEQVASISENKDILIFDLVNQSCLQSIAKKWVTLGPRPISAVYFHGPRQALILSTNQLAVLEHKEEDIRSVQLTSHTKPISHVLYNPLFEQLVSGGSDSLVCMWNVHSGKREMQFTAHRHVVDGVEVDLEITAMEFDPTMRRLITAGRDGSVKIWNFNNGALLRMLETFDTMEITGIVCPAMRIITAGWNKHMTVYVDDQEDESVLAWDNQHRDDILTLDFYPPGTVASASYDGDILLWSLETGRVNMRFNANEGTTAFMTIDRVETARSLDSLEDADDRGLLSSALETGSKRVFEVVPEITGTDCLSNTNVQSGRNSSARHSIKESEISVCKGRNKGTAVEKLLFLKSRPQHKQTATLLSSDGLGWIRAWACHHEGGLLGQFNAAHKRGEAVLSMTTDKNNEYLITGDSAGYIKVWDLNKYCCFSEHVQTKLFRSRIERYKKFPFLSIEPLLRRRIRDQTRHKIPPAPSQPGSTMRVPPLLNSFRAHLHTITSLDFIDDREMIISASSDCSIRMWSISGQYVGIFGQHVPWAKDGGLPPAPDPTTDSPRQCFDLGNKIEIEHLNEKNLPPDVRRVASATTLKVFYGGSRPLWKLAKNIIMVWVPMLLQRKKEKEIQAKKEQERRQKRLKKPIQIKQIVHRVMIKKAEEKEKPEGLENESDDEDSLEIPEGPIPIIPSEIISRHEAFKTGRRHQLLPEVNKLRTFQNQVAVYNNLPCYDLAAVSADIEPPQTIQEIQERNRSIAASSTPTPVRRGNRRSIHARLSAEQFSNPSSVGSGNLLRRSTKQFDSNSSLRRKSVYSPQGRESLDHIHENASSRVHLPQLV